MILLDPIGLGESTDGDSNDDEDENGTNNTLSQEDSSTECNFTFIGANVLQGKSSMRSKPKDKKVSFVAIIKTRCCRNVFCAFIHVYYTSWIIYF